MSLYTPPEDQIRLRIGGRELAGWKTATITQSIEDVARSFTVSAASRYPEEIQLLRVKPGSAVEVYLGSELLITGWIDKQDATFDRSSHGLTLSGRSKTGDLVDCSVIHASGQWRNTSAVEIARQLAADYGVELVDELGSTPNVRRFAVQDGETVVGAIQRLAQLRGFLVTDDERGRLVLTRASSTRADVELRTGVNILRGSASVDFSARYTEYRCKSSRVGDDQDFGAVLQASQTATDAGDMGRARILEIRAEKGEDAARTKERATWEAATRYGQSIAVSYDVQGWRQTAGGRTWRRNEIVRVVDELTGLNGDLLVTDVELTVARSSGTVAKLTLAPPEGFELLPPFKPRRSGRKRVKNPLAEALKDGVTITPGGQP